MDPDIPPGTYCAQDDQMHCAPGECAPIVRRRCVRCGVRTTNCLQCKPFFRLDGDTCECTGTNISLGCD